MNKILSIIIPTYNMEKYLRYCLDSLLIKTNFNNIEVIVVNDGSKDLSLSIANEYKSNYPEVFKVIDKENGNYGSCINAGLLVATGKYVKVLDADDSFDTTNFEGFVNYLKLVDADVILSDYVIVDENRNITSQRHYDFPVNEPMMMEDICCTDSFKDMQMHAVTYRRQNLVSMKYSQVEGVSYTDQQWIFIPMVTASCVYCFDHYVYKYMLGRIGQTMDRNVRLKSINHLMTCLLGMVDDYNRHIENCSANIVEYLHSRLFPQIRDIYISTFINYNSEYRGRLLAFDEALRSKNLILYDMIGASLRFNYITFWREWHRILDKHVVRWVSRLYLYIIRKKNRRNA